MDKLDTIRTLINNIDWDFKEKSNKKDVNSIHPYPAKFIAEIPRNLIEILGVKEDTAILDPFCGSGTTLVEANKLGIPVIGIDLNPIACLISKIKTSKTPTNFLCEVENCVIRAKARQTHETIDIKNVDHWFKEEVKEAIHSLIEEINDIHDQQLKEFLKVGLSSIIVRVSNQESDTRYAAIEKEVKKEDVYRLFLESCKNIEKAKETLPVNDSGVTIINENVLNVTKEDIKRKIGLVITSPPYPNAYEYWLYHKYRMWWLGYDAEAVKRDEIGARAHYFKKDSQTSNDFINQMDTLFKLFNDVVIPGGYICIVIGRSIIHGEVVDNAKIVEELAKKYNMKEVSNITRGIASNRKSFNLSHAKIKKENILIFQTVEKMEEE